MNTKLNAAIALAFSALAAGNALAADTPKTRAEVRAEYLQAVRSGNIVEASDQGLRLNERFAARYEQAPAGVGLTREQVKAELAQAVRTGNIVEASDQGLPLNVTYATRYPQAGAVSTKSRAEVKAELSRSYRFEPVNLS